MSIYTEAREKIAGLDNDQWQNYSEKVAANPEYGSHQTAKNLRLVLAEMGISLPEDDKTLNEMLESVELERFAANKLFALATNQPKWFENLQRGIDDPGVPAEPDQFAAVRQRVEHHFTGKLN